jgi:hypothetical protein
LRRLILILAIAMLAGACSSGEEPLRGIDLPPAAVPDEIEPEAWALAFTHDFAPGSWTEGTHVYALALACDAILDEPLRTDPFAFDVVAASDTFDQPIYLRPVGLSHFMLGPQTLTTIDPQQPTTAMLTVIGVAKGDADVATESCAGAIFFDEEDPLPLDPQTPFRP